MYEIEDANAAPIISYFGTNRNKRGILNIMPRIEILVPTIGKPEPVDNLVIIFTDDKNIEPTNKIVRGIYDLINSWPYISVIKILEKINNKTEIINIMKVEILLISRVVSKDDLKLLELEILGYKKTAMESGKYKIVWAKSNAIE